MGKLYGTKNGKQGGKVLTYIGQSNNAVVDYDIKTIVPNWAGLTSEDFMLEFITSYGGASFSPGGNIPANALITCPPTKTYNPVTGILTAGVAYKYVQGSYLSTNQTYGRTYAYANVNVYLLT